MTKGMFLVVVLVLSLAFPFASSAQEQTDGMTACDSTLVTLLFIAEHDYGYHAMGVDTSTLEKGAYAPWFEEMMAMMEEGDMTEEPMEDEMLEEEEMMEEGEMSENMMTLAPGNVVGENEACTALRAELEAFFYDHFAGMME
jgi:hypothetical protein